MIPFPIGTDRPQRHLPWMNYFLITCNILFYMASHDSARGAGLGNLAEGWNKYILDPTHPTLYQFITYQFLHENLAHIFFNMLFLYVFGNNLNEKLGNIGYLAFYLAGGVLAGCGQVLTSTAPTLGASGAISAVTGMFLVLLPRTNIRLFIWIIVYLDVWEIPSVYFILFSVLKDLLEPLLWGGNHTAYAAHLTGNAVGFIIGLTMLLGHLVQRDHYDLLAMIDRWRRRREYISVVSKGYDPFSSKPARSVLRTGDDSLAAPADPRVEQLRLDISERIDRHELVVATAKYLELLAIDNSQVLPPQDQLDVANQLMADGRHNEAATAYENYLRVYKGGSHPEQIQLLLGVVYARYLHQTERAKELLSKALPRLHDPRQQELAREELTILGVPPDASPHGI